MKPEHRAPVEIEPKSVGFRFTREYKCVIRGMRVNLDLGEDNQGGGRGKVVQHPYIKPTFPR